MESRGGLLCNGEIQMNHSLIMRAARAVGENFTKSSISVNPLLPSTV